MYFSVKPGSCKINVCEIVLDDGASVVNLAPRQIPGGIRDAVRAVLDKLLDNGVIVESRAEWASPLVPVRKKDGSIRLYVDYRELNARTPLRRFWLPSLTEIIEKVGPSLCLSTLDLTSGFHQIEMSESSSELTTFVYPLGKYKYNRMPFGLKNAPAIFQAAVEEVLTPVREVCKNYIDDVVVDLGNVVRCLGDAGFTLKVKKCVFGQKYLEYLGHRVGGGVLAVPEVRIKAMAEFELPRTKKLLRSFLGSMSYYRQFIDGYARLSSMLSPAVALKAPQGVVWMEGMTAAFRELKLSLCNHVVLTIPGPEDEFVLYTDASGDGIGGCLHVNRSDGEEPVAFYSRQLRPAERNYSITELESLAIVASINHFEYHVYGRPLRVVTDHKACMALRSSSNLNRRLLRFVLAVQDRVVEIVHRPGACHGNADGLSRQCWDRDESDVATLGLSATPPGHGLEGGDVGVATREKKREE